MRNIGLALIALGVMSGAAHALPEAVVHDYPSFQLAGQGRLRWFGLHIYDAKLWAENGKFDVAGRFALDISYAREISSKRLVQSSLDEMRRLGWDDVKRLAAWRDAMTKVFPDVHKGDSITGVNVPGSGVVFYHREKSIGVIDDREFARAFFAIWLDPRTREPGLRNSLMGKP